MPIVTDPAVARATVALKRSQTRLTTLRRKHLEGDYLSRAVVQDFVVQLAAEFRQKILELPPRLRRIIPGPPNFKLEDDFEKIIDTFLRELAETAVIVPEPERPKGAYTTKPGPRPKRFNNGAPPKALEAAE